MVTLPGNRAARSPHTRPPGLRSRLQRPAGRAGVRQERPEEGWSVLATRQSLRPLPGGVLGTSTLRSHGASRARRCPGWRPQAAPCVGTCPFLGRPGGCFPDTSLFRRGIWPRSTQVLKAYSSHLAPRPRGPVPTVPAPCLRPWSAWGSAQGRTPLGDPLPVAGLGFLIGKVEMISGVCLLTPQRL